MTISVSPAPSPPTAPAPAAKRVKYKRSLKNYMLDPRFQLKWTGMMIAVAFVISAIMGVFLYRTTSEVTAQSHKVIASENQCGDAPSGAETKSRTTNVVVSTEPIITTNITGFL